MKRWIVWFGILVALVSGFVAWIASVPAQQLSSPLIPQASIPFSGSEYVYLLQAGRSVKTTLGNLAGYLNGNPSSAFNVVFYGADPTCVANSLPAFNKAEEAAVAAGGGTIFIPRGTYCLSGSWNITASNIDVECDSQFDTIVNETADNTNLIVWGSATYTLDAGPIVNGRIRNCTLENPGTGAITPTAGALIQENRVAGLKMQDLTIWPGFKGIDIHGNGATYLSLIEDVHGHGLSQSAQMPGSAMISIDKVFVCTPGSPGCHVAGSIQDPATGQYFKDSEGFTIIGSLFYAGSTASMQWGIHIGADDGATISSNYVGGFYGADLHHQQSTPVTGYIDETIASNFFDQGNGPGTMPNTWDLEGNAAIGTNGLTANVTYTSTSATISFASASGTLQNGEAIDDPSTCGGGSHACLADRQHFLYNVAQTGSSGTAQVSYTGAGGAVTADPAIASGTAQATDFNAFGNGQGMMVSGNRFHGGRNACIRFDSTLPPSIPDNFNITGAVCGTSGGVYTNDGIDILGRINNLSITGFSAYLVSPAIGILIGDGQNINITGGLINGGAIGVEMTSPNQGTVSISDMLMSGQTVQDVVNKSTFLITGVVRNVTGQSGVNSDPAAECTADAATTINFSPACDVVKIVGPGTVEIINVDPTATLGRANQNPSKPILVEISGTVSIENCSSCNTIGNPNILMDASYAARGSTISLADGSSFGIQSVSNTFNILAITQPGSP